MLINHNIVSLICNLIFIYKCLSFLIIKSSSKKSVSDIFVDHYNSKKCKTDSEIYKNSCIKTLKLHFLV